MRTASYIIVCALMHCEMHCTLVMYIKWVNNTKLPPPSPTFFYYSPPLILLLMLIADTIIKSTIENRVVKEKCI